MSVGTGELRWRERIDAPMIRRGRPAAPGAIRLGANESPYGLPRAVAEAIEGAFAQANRYAFGQEAPLVSGIASWLSVPESRIVPGNGSNDLLERLLRGLGGEGNEIIYPHPTFPIFSNVSKASGATPVPVPLTSDGRNDLTALAAAVTDRTSLLVICNPNNPTGPAIPTSEVAAMIHELPPHVVVILDEAYFEMSDEHAAGTRGGVEVLDGDRPVICTRTFSKYFGLAGLRVGYGITSSDELAAQLRLRLGPSGMNRLSIAGAVAALGCLEEYERRLVELRAERARVHAELSALGLNPYRSETNFLLFDEPRAATVDRLGDEGVWIRSGESVLFPGKCRVTVGSPAENDTFLECIAAEAKEAAAR
jgi:histidinol-phosphate aminotransferase